MKRSIVLFVSALMIVMFQNCAQSVDFKTQSETIDLGSTGGSDTSPTPTSVPTDPSRPEHIEQFKVAFNSEAAPLDMMWVIDNSGSMSEEAASVRKNFEAFLKALNMSTNFRLLLMTSTDTMANGVTIPSSFSEDTHRQVNRKVGSWNGTKVLLEEVAKISSGFLRADSKKIIIFVTDDNSRDYTADGFMDKLIANQKWSREDVSVSSFIGLSEASSPCMAAEGTVYKELASDTKGRTYNICKEDWSSYFSDIINVSVSKAIRRFTLTKVNSVSEIVEVRVDGKVISQSLYTLANKVLTLADSVNLAENSQISVVYK